MTGEAMARIRGHERRYLVVAMRLADFELNREDVRLWVRVFDLLCGRATHVVGVVEDFAGGYVWELGLLWAREYREKVWILKRRYANEETERERYDNGMAISHVALLLTGPRSVEWDDVAALEAAVDEVP